MHIACQRGYENMVFYLLTLGFAGVNVGTHNGATALHMVAEKGYTDLAAWLLRAGAAVNVRCLIVDVNTKKTSFNITPLNQACGFGHAKIVRMLLAVSARLCVLRTPLLAPHGSVFCERLFLLLSQAGADPYAGENFEGEDGITALHCAAIRGRVHIVPILVAAGVSVNVRDEKGNTPLHWAVRECFYDCCRVLIDHGADVGLRNKVRSLSANHRRQPTNPIALSLCFPERREGRVPGQVQRHPRPVAEARAEQREGADGQCPLRARRSGEWRREAGGVRRTFEHRPAALLRTLSTRCISTRRYFLRSKKQSNLSRPPLCTKAAATRCGEARAAR